ncbi:MAG: hypothetical protein GY880_19250 [Planctomycetaceae bacterium]|nr:hypothetical protein [Bacteroidota bacterium]MCP4776367.1 hypothetical protein [Planctomycetaceae bacterium]
MAKSICLVTTKSPHDLFKQGLGLKKFGMPIILLLFNGRSGMQYSILATPQIPHSMLAVIHEASQLS